MFCFVFCLSFALFCFVFVFEYFVGFLSATWMTMVS